MSQLLQTILTRRSVRRFTGAPVARELLEQLAQAAMAAPTSRDTRHFRIVLVDDPARIEALTERLPFAKMLATAKHAVVVASDLTAAHGGGSTDYWAQDCAAATENVLLAAHALGLGACWTAAHPRPERVAIVREVLALPETVMPLCVIAVGHPAGEEKPRDKFNPAFLFWNTFCAADQRG